MSLERKEVYARQLLLPYWNDAAIATLSLSLVGLGGLGACVLVALTLMGIGRRLVLCDHDIITVSNLARLPYATPDHVGRLKVDVAAEWVKRMRPDVEVVTVPLSIIDRAAQEVVVTSEILLGLVDQDLARYVNQGLAAAFYLPYFDAGSGVKVDELFGTVICVPSGQVRVYIPGSTPCLFCTLGLDQVAMNRDIAAELAKTDDTIEDTLRATGYLTGSLADEAPTPSVYNLNSTVAGILVEELVRYLTTGLAGRANAIVLDLAVPTVDRITPQSAPNCPFCGPSAPLGTGNFFSLADHCASAVPDDHIDPALIVNGLE